MAQLMGEIRILQKYGPKGKKNGLNQGFFEYLECNFASLLGPTNNKLHAHVPSGILMLWR